MIPRYIRPKAIRRHPGRIGLHLHASGGIVRLLHIGIEPRRRQALQDLPPQLIASYGGEQAGPITELRHVPCKIGRSSTQTFPLREDVPEDLPDANHCLFHRFLHAFYHPYGPFSHSACPPSDCCSTQISFEVS